jgi:glycosyltransferase involved in cell wall biosynthesis
MYKPKISFVVPLYNKEAYIAECLEALTNQTEKDIEIIVVDDGSTDDSLAIANYVASKDERIRVFPLGANQGRSFARNFGNQQAKAKIIAVQDADDVAAPNRAEETLKAFKKRIDLFYSSFYTTDYIVQAEKFDIEEVKKDLYTRICHSTMAYKKDIGVDYAEGEYSDLGIDDWKFQMDAYRLGRKFGFSDKPLVLYRTTSNSISKSRDEKTVEALKREYFKCL